MSEERTILMFARLGRDERRALMAEAAAAACEVHAVESLEAAALALAARPPPAVLIDLSLEDAQKVCRKVRSKRRAVDVAIFGLTTQITDSVFARALKWGVDDVTSPLVEGALATRLIALPLDPTIPVADRGDAVVATHDENENLVGRLLTNAGYDVEYASDSTSLLHLGSLERMRLVVATPELGSPRDLIEVTRRRGGNATWVVLAAEEQIPKLEREVTGLGRVGVVSAADSLDHILFVSNELAMSEDRVSRTERRILHGTLCSFCPLGSAALEHGFTYNVSPSGLYIRTLSPPREDEVRLDVLAPGTETPVRLEGHVAWRRGFGRLGSATAPPGFGLRLTEGSLEDRTLWARSCTTLLVNRAAPAKPRAVPPIPAASTDKRAAATEVAAAPAALGDVEPTVPSPPVEALPFPQAAARGATPARADGSSKPDSVEASREENVAEPPPAAADRAPEAAAKVARSRPPAAVRGPRPPSTQPRPRSRPPGATLPAGAEARTAPLSAGAPPSSGAVIRRSVAAGLLLGALGALLFVAAVFWFEGSKPAPRGGAPAVARPGAARTDGSSALARPAVSDRGEEPADPVTVPGELPPDASASAAPTASAVPSITSALSPSAAPPAITHEPALDLATYEGYLEVAAPIDTQVYSNGVHIGATGARHKVRCGLRFVRIGDAPGQWRSDGITVDVLCRQLTRVQLTPTP